MTDPLPFDEGTDADRESWTDLALTLRKQKRLVARVALGTFLVLKVEGECPRCRHNVAFTFQEEIVAPAATPRGVAGGSAARPNGGTLVNRDFSVACFCTHDHPGRTSGELGCGSVFGITVKV